jgi:hypothetical protein
MSQKALFITEKQLKDASLINENVSMVKLRPTLIMCQEMHIQPILGSDLYKEIANQIIADDLTQENEDLLIDYIQPCLQMFVQMEFPMAFGFQLRNKNVERGTDQNSTQASMSELQRLIDYYKSKAEWYAERITRYILTNITDFPAYQSPSGQIDTILPNRRNYTAGLVLNNYGCCGDYASRYQANFNRDCDCY